ncbi:FAD-dependent oxidoreductase [Myxococcus stipitatus]|uniref:FAD-dependent oxidoreductase n=1 Tax=Myxococcus stipitatus TaxID=83455 RepID=UPI0030D0CB30
MSSSASSAPSARSSHPRIAVVGAGPAGLTAAYVLARAGAQVEVHEGSRVVGGLARSLDLWNQRVDLGPHRFYTQDARINALWESVVGQDWATVESHPGVLRNDGQVLRYPLQVADVVRKVGFTESVRCVLEYGMQQLRPLPEVRTFEDWLVQRFGRRVFEQFFRDYNEKFFGRPCSQIDAGVSGSASKDSSLIDTVLNALRMGVGITRARAVKQVTEKFPFPHRGTGEVYERMARFIRDNGGEVLLESRVEALEVEGRKVTGLRTAKGSRAYDFVISSAPLVPLVAQLPGQPPEVQRALVEARDVLTFRSAVLVYLEVHGTNLFPESWLEMHTRAVRTCRVTNFRNWVPGLYGQERSSILCVEYWCAQEEDLWTHSDEAMAALAQRELESVGLLGSTPVGRVHVVRLPRCFPVYQPGYQRVLQPLQTHLDGFERLSSIGRGGRFSYNSQDANWRMGLEAADGARAALGF